MRTAYEDASGRVHPDTVGLGAGIVNGMSLPGGLHKWSSSVSFADSLYFDAGSNPETVWILQIAGSLNLGAGARVTLMSGARARNIFWQIAGAVAILAGAHMEGVVLCATHITFGAGGSLNGRGLVQTKATMIATTILAPPLPSPPPSPPSPPTQPPSPPPSPPPPSLPLPPSPPPLQLLVGVTDNGGADGALSATVFVNVNTRVYITGDHANALAPHVSMAWFVPAGASCGGPPSQLINNPVYGGFLGADHSVEVTLPTVGVFMACTLVAPSGIGRRLAPTRRRRRHRPRRRRRAPH
eukprot:scaffold98489_cov51-Phaeocystis_antarctica.AAC.1